MEGQMVNCWQGRVCPSLTDAHEEQASLVQSHRASIVAQVAVKFKLSEHTVDHNVAADCPLPKAPTIGTWTPQVNHKAIEGGGLIGWVMFSFTSCGRACVWFIWGRISARMHYGGTSHSLQDLKDMLLMFCLQIPEDNFRVHVECMP